MGKLDLNLVVIFDAIMREQSITAAAQRLSMAQPSVSNAVARMRYSWNDPLFVKQGRGIRPTPRASQLWLQISEPLETISSAITPRQFEPDHSTRRFRIALTDGMVTLIWLSLRKIVERHAPGIDIHAVPYKGDGESLLLNADVDLIFDYYSGASQQVHSKWMFDNHFVCVMRAAHEFATGDFSLDKFVQAEHVLVSLTGDPSGVVDTILGELNLTRRVVMTVNSFAGAIELLKETNLITVLPYPAVAQAIANGDLIFRASPIDVPPARISMAWHHRQNHDPGLRWLRGVLDEIVQSKRALFDVKSEA